MVVIVVLAAVVVYLIIKYARKFKESRDEMVIKLNLSERAGMKGK